MSQSHVTLRFPLRGPADAQALAEQLPALMPVLCRAQDAIGRVHYSRFTMLSDETLLYLADFDGDLGSLMASLARTAGPVFDAILSRVADAPAARIADHAHAFVEWTAAHLLHDVDVYSAYPEVSVKAIKAMAYAAGLTSLGELRPFLVVLPMASHLAFVEAQLALRARAQDTTRDLDMVGTSHFAQFVPLEDNQLGFFSVYDGNFGAYVADLTRDVGPVFDLLFTFTKNPPPSPCRRHLHEFIDFIEGATRPPIGFYQAYPGLSVHDIHTLIADRTSSSVPKVTAQEKRQ
jgi:hypothetical protein